MPARHEEGDRREFQLAAVLPQEVGPDMPDGVDAVVMRLTLPAAVTETVPTRAEPFGDAPLDRQDDRP